MFLDKATRLLLPYLPEMHFPFHFLTILLTNMSTTQVIWGFLYAGKPLNREAQETLISQLCLAQF